MWLQTDSGIDQHVQFTTVSHVSYSILTVYSMSYNQIQPHITDTHRYDSRYRSKVYPVCCHVYRTCRTEYLSQFKGPMWRIQEDLLVEYYILNTRITTKIQISDASHKLLLFSCMQGPGFSVSCELVQVVSVSKHRLFFFSLVAAELPLEQLLYDCKTMDYFSNPAFHL